jgi:hypothetical protein
MYIALSLVNVIRFSSVCCLYVQPFIVDDLHTAEQLIGNPVVEGNEQHHR